MKIKVKDETTSAPDEEAIDIESVNEHNALFVRAFGHYLLKNGELRNEKQRERARRTATLMAEFHELETMRGVSELPHQLSEAREERDRLVADQEALRRGMRATEEYTAKLQAESDKQAKALKIAVEGLESISGCYKVDFAIMRANEALADIQNLNTVEEK
jgi:hypothetical protein